MSEWLDWIKLAVILVPSVMKLQRSDQACWEAKSQSWSACSEEMKVFITLEMNVLPHWPTLPTDSNWVRHNRQTYWPIFQKPPLIEGRHWWRYLTFSPIAQLLVMWGKCLKIKTSNWPQHSWMTVGHADRGSLFCQDLMQEPSSRRFQQSLPSCVLRSRIHRMPFKALERWHQL